MPVSKKVKRTPNKFAKYGKMNAHRDRFGVKQSPRHENDLEFMRRMKEGLL